MKIIGLFLLYLSLSAFGQRVILSEYDYRLSDAQEMGFSKTELFNKMDRKIVRVKDSICSNRAHVWAYDLKKQNIDSAKVFMFLTRKTSYFDGASWWYHVAPAINHNGKLWVIDAGFPDRIKSPLLVNEWLKEFNGKDSACKEIKSEEEVLLRLMFGDHVFPETTTYGTYNCYYRITPPGYWTPTQVATNLLGRDESGRPSRLEREDLDEKEVMKACLETSTTPIGYFMRQGLKKCEDFIGSNSHLNF
jgi:Glutaminase